MKHMIRGIILSCLGIASLQAATSYIAFRSQAVNAARELIGWQSLINHPCAESCYAALSITPEYNHSFQGGEIAQAYFFPDSLCKGTQGATIGISGSLTPLQEAPFAASNTNRDVHEWLADYFGLPRDYASTLCFKPSMATFVTDLNAYIGFDGWVEGLYFRIHAPLESTTWDLNVNEYDKKKGSIGYDPGYFDPLVCPPAKLLPDALAFFSGCQAPALPTASFETLRYSKFATGCDGLHKTGLADIEMALGWNFLRSCRYHFGIEVRASAPTGNKPCAEYLFSPVVGSGGHWKLGGGFTMHGIMWQSADECQTFGLYLDANIQHLFSTCQERTFDLCCLPNSRYMLAQKLEDNTHDLGTVPDVGPVVISTAQFAGVFAPIANLTTRTVDVSVDVEGDLVIDLVYTIGNLQWELGYELWSRGAEKICPKKGSCSRFATESWALKGDAYVYGFNPDDTTWYPMAATESKATMHAGTNFTTDTPITTTNPAAAWYNPKIDNAQPASVNVTTMPSALLGAPGTEPTRTSIQPIVIAETGVNYQGTATRGSSNKVFTYIGYTWHEKRRCTPFVGFGAFAEFAAQSGADHCAKTSCFPGCTMGCAVECTTTPIVKQCIANNCSQECGVSQWGLWFKGGIGF